MLTAVNTVMMKQALRFCLVLFVLFSVLHPCADALLCTVAESHADTENHKEDACSPFCVCACCGISFISQYLMEFAPLFNESSKLAFFYQSFFSENFNPSLLQPPRPTGFNS